MFAENKWLKKRSAELEAAVLQMRTQFEKAELDWKSHLMRLQVEAEQIARTYEEKFQQAHDRVRQLDEDYSKLKRDVLTKDREIRQLHVEMRTFSELASVAPTAASSVTMPVFNPSKQDRTNSGGYAGKSAFEVRPGCSPSYASLLILKDIERAI